MDTDIDIFEESMVVVLHVYSKIIFERKATISDWLCSSILLIVKLST